MSTSPLPAPAKVCVRCGTDCAGKPRVKDQHGRYTCQPCVNQLKAARPAQAAATPSLHAPEPTTPEPEGFDVFDLAPEPSSPKTSPCGNCGRPVSEQAVVCVGCGFSKQLGRVLTPDDAPKSEDLPRGKRIQCKKCGYDLRGLKTAKCPECGTMNAVPSRRERDREDSAKVARDAYLQPALMFIIGALISTITYAAYVSHMGGNPAVGAMGYLVYLGVSVPIGVIVYWTCCLVWIGFDAPIHLIALRLAGIYAVTDVGYGLFAFVPLPWWAENGVVGFIYIGLLQHFLDMDLEDAVIVGLLTFIVKAVAVLVIMSKMGVI